MRLAVAATVLVTQSLSAGADRSASSSSSSQHRSAFLPSGFGRPRRPLEGGRRGAGLSWADPRRALEDGGAVVGRRRRRDNSGGIGGRPTLRSSVTTTTTTTAEVLGAPGRDAATTPTRTSQECDPYDTINDVLGVLSCGPGMYCLESRGSPGEWDNNNNNGGDPLLQAPPSALGGTCVEGTKGEETAAAGALHRQLQGYSTNLIESLAYLCDLPAANGLPGCECEDVDVEAYTGFASCSSPEPSCTEFQTNYCSEDFTECQTVDTIQNFTGPYDFMISTCTNFTSPETIASCTAVTFDGSPYPVSCSLEVEGVDCNSCGFEEIDPLYGGNSTICMIFDCTNTVLEEAGYSCYGGLEDFISYSFFNNESLPCEGGCYVCDGGNIPEEGLNKVTIPGQEGSVPCYLLDFYAISGLYFGAEFCANPNRSIYAEQCGCPGSAGGDNSTSTTMEPTGMPTTEEEDYTSEAPVAAPETEEGSAGGTAASSPTTGPPSAPMTPSGASTAMIKTTGLMIGLVAAAAAYGAVMGH